VDYEVFCGPRRKIVDGFQRAEHIESADESNALTAIIDPRRPGHMGGQSFERHAHPLLTGVEDQGIDPPDWPHCAARLLAPARASSAAGVCVSIECGRVV